MLSTKRNKYQCSSKWAFSKGRGAARVEKSKERAGRAHKRGLGGPAVAAKPRAPRKVSPAQYKIHQKYLIMILIHRRIKSKRE